MNISEKILGPRKYTLRQVIIVTIEINVFPRPTREAWDKPYEELEVGDRLVVHSEATVMSRFMTGRR